ncbi:DeoR/GlpR family DNA-binding transcription regulator [Brucella gallinifaecis]|uniref:DeoR/GlpR transcriptional regulator n=1 Tax=Brucella gallinifaecis TaxID=215590 RepID=A0A502BK58_9HYPH|nr:DeoR/GlpR family DNA-binding transcription regulator [Brucella gallinifaecis]TPF73868.1 DeoR/GlpR transcriptional regulator [Brucella gallinifaecis]
MWQDERHKKIQDYLTAFGRISIDQITEEIGVSRETIRRDLMELEQAGKLKRVRGGAVPLAKEDTDFHVRVNQRLLEKQAIAMEALNLLSNDMTVFIDAGTTTTVMAEVLSNHHGLSGLNILTNSIDVARLLSGKENDSYHRYKVHLLSGDVRQDPLETWGASTINDINRYRADVALLAPWGIDPERGAMNHFIHGAEIARAMVRNSAKTIILADHSKISAPARSVFCTIDEISHLIVDRKARDAPDFPALVRSIASVIVSK